MTARYTYLADATKLEVVDGDGWGYDYLGSLVYRKNDDDTYTLESTPFSGGRIVRNSSGSYRINGFVTDHLGSIRTVYDVETGDIIERNDYYPFGKRLNNSLAMSPTNRYRFSGKVARGSQRTFLCSRPEQQGFSPPVQQVVADINLLDFGARMYDDEICRWTTVDPLAEKYYSMTPYNYCANNPVMFVDPEGEDWRDINGNIINDHSKIMVYIFYDPNSFSSQSEKMYKNAVAKYGEESVAMSNVTTEKEFSKDWGDMGSNIIKEVDLNYHGNNQTLMLDSSNYEYLTATGDGKSNILDTGSTNVQDLPEPSGNIDNAQLNINSCKSNSKTQYPLKGTRQTLMESFSNTFNFETVRGTSFGVSYNRFTKQPFPGHSWNHGEWDYHKRPRTHVSRPYPGKGLIQK